MTEETPNSTNSSESSSNSGTDSRTLFWNLLSPLPAPYFVLGILVVGGIWWFLNKETENKNTPDNNQPGIVTEKGEKEYCFCTWNAENFFDDQDDPKHHDKDEDFFGQHPEMFREKVNRLSDALLKMNQNRGPDIIALCEVESLRALEALKEALNGKLRSVKSPATPYSEILFVDNHTGRHFAPGIITRLPVYADRTRRLGSGGLNRILEGHIHIENQELIVIAAHWTSRVTEEEGHGSKREKYADQCYGRFRAILHENPNAAVVVCGDFNDELTDLSVQDHLHATTNETMVRNSNEQNPLLFAIDGILRNSKDPKGTIYGRGHWSIFDHICLSKGLLDTQNTNRHWHADYERSQIFAPSEMRNPKTDAPIPFGHERHKGIRGFSDHFPVITYLHIGP